MAALAAALLLVAIVALATSSLTAAASAPAGAGDDGADTARQKARRFSWREGGRTRTIWLRGDEVAVVLGGSPPTPALERRLLRRVNDGRQKSGPVRRQTPSLLIVPMAAGAGTDPSATLSQARRALLADPAVAQVGAVFSQGTPGSGATAVGTGEVIVRFRRGVASARRASLLAGAGLSVVRSFVFASDTLLARARTPLEVFAAVRSLQAEAAVVYAVPSFHRLRTERAVPDDPLFGRQWHLRNPGGNGLPAGIDLRVLSVWDRLRGAGQVIAVADDGLEIRHPDLAANVLPGTDDTGSFDWVDEDRDPTPMLPEDDHGTACAGTAAARGFNGLGVSGVAPEASLVGYRFLDVDSDAVEGEVLGNSRSGVFDNRSLVDIVNSSWGPTDDRHLEGPGPLAQQALEDGIANGRAGKGTIYVWAGGNGRAAEDNVNFDGYANSRFTIAVGAVNANGKVASYSEDGAPLCVCAPSSGVGRGIVTTDRTGTAGYNAAPSPSGDYTSAFSGTSAAAPQVAGVVALMLQANPELGWRDVQQILMRTARKIDALHPDWTTNVAGYHVNHSYGFGLVDARAAVEAAKSWTPLAAETAVEGTAEVKAPIPDGSGSGVSSSISLAAALPAVRIEYVEVYFTALHPFWSDLEVTLVAPSGTRSILATPAPFAGLTDPEGRDYTDWRFGTTRHLGESSRGTWTLRVRDLSGGDKGSFVRWRLRVYGTPLPDDVSPPVTRLADPVRLWWDRAPLLSLTAVDIGSNVRRTEYRIGGSEDDPFTPGRVVRLAASRETHKNDGRYVVWYRSVDNAEPPNVEAARSVVVNIDTRPPWTEAPRPARVVRGGTARLFYRVLDPGFSARKASVKLVVRNAQGRAVKTLVLRSQPTGALASAAFRCTLPKGAYRFTVYATDLAGNTQRRAGSNSLTVR